MNINLHIERLVLDGVLLSPRECPLLKATIEADLTRRLASGGVFSDGLLSGGALSNVRTARIQLTNDGNPASLGEQIAGSVYRGISQ